MALDRRDFLKDLALGVPGALAALGAGGLGGGLGCRLGATLHAQVAAPNSARPNPNFPQVPTWDTELRELAPNVYAYIQAGGPGRDNVSVSDAGFIVGDDGVMVIDALAAPIDRKSTRLNSSHG